MTEDLKWLLYSVILAWLMLLASSLFRARAWTPAGLLVAFGNRDNLAPATPMDGRADRAAKNMLESLLLLVRFCWPRMLRAGSMPACCRARSCSFGAA